MYREARPLSSVEVRIDRLLPYLEERNFNTLLFCRTALLSCSVEA